MDIKTYLKKFKKIIRYKETRLIMCILVKNEADIIEHCLNFNKLMGVDGFIVTDNNSTDGTRQILETYKSKGWIYEIIDEPGVTYYQDKWCDRMIKLAIYKYKATWIISSDADEFWYSEYHNLKQSISMNNCDILYINAMHLYPPIEDACSFEQLVQNSYFRYKNYDQAELNFYNLNSKDNTFKLITNTKCIFKSKKYKKIRYGNHSCEMKHGYKACYSSNIKLFHLGIRGFKHFESKVQNFAKAWQDHPFANLTNYPYYYEYIKNGKGHEIYDKIYLFSRFEDLKLNNIIVKDLTLYIYLKSIDYFK